MIILVHGVVSVAFACLFMEWWSCQFDMGVSIVYMFAYSDFFLTTRVVLVFTQTLVTQFFSYAGIMPRSS